jgi:neutral ceramidase
MPSRIDGFHPSAEAELGVGFASRDITPPPGTRKLGWLREVVGEEALDPIQARAVVWSAGASASALVVLDTLCVSANLVARVRERVASHCGIGAERLMVAATHNHAGPAVHHSGDVAVEQEFVDELIGTLAELVAAAAAATEPARMCHGRAGVLGLSENRRTVTYAGTVKTETTFEDPSAAWIEGPIDPALDVVAFRDSQGAPLGIIAAFACHPTDHGESRYFTAGWPGVVCRDLEAGGWPNAIFLNGAFGDVRPHFRGPSEPSKELVGSTLAARALELERSLAYNDLSVPIVRSVVVKLPFRQPPPAEIEGAVAGAERFVDPAIYDRWIPSILEKIRREGQQVAEVQVIDLGALVLVGLPGEVFARLGLEIKQGLHPRHAVLVGAANGMVGYVPFREAYPRGGYEVTFGPSSWLGPGAGEILRDAAIAVGLGGGSVS